VFLGGLAHRLAEITGEAVAREAIENAEALKDVVQGQLEAIASKGQRVKTQAAPADELSEYPLTMAVLPSADSETEKPWSDSPTAPRTARSRLKPIPVRIAACAR
jgi:hypothetical protein